MTKEEFIGKLQMAYIGDKNALNECTQEYLRLKKTIDKIEHILSNQMDYREFVDIINAMDDVIKEWKDE